MPLGFMLLVMCEHRNVNLQGQTQCQQVMFGNKMTTCANCEIILYCTECHFTSAYTCVHCYLAT